MTSEGNSGSGDDDSPLPSIWVQIDKIEADSTSWNSNKKRDSNVPIEERPSKKTENNPSSEKVDVNGFPSFPAMKFNLKKGMQ